MKSKHNFRDLQILEHEPTHKPNRTKFLCVVKDLSNGHNGSEQPRKKDIQQYTEKRYVVQLYSLLQPDRLILQSKAV